MTAPGPVTHDLASLYLATRVTVVEGGTRVPAHASALAAAGPFHVITAWNPGHQRPGAEQNSAANARLLAHLQALGLHPAPALGSDPQSSHAEESWAVPGLTDTGACAIGAAYGQVAVFRTHAAQQTVLACDGAWQTSRTITRPPTPQEAR